MKRSFCRVLCILLCCVLLLGISACTRQDFPSSEPPVESQQTEAIAETVGENVLEQPLIEKEATCRKDETYHLKETSTHDNIEEIVDNVFRSDDDSFVEGTYERRYSERYTVKGTRVANADGDASNALRNADIIIQQDVYGNIVSVCGSNETQNEDINPEYFTENWIDDRKPYNTHQVEDRNVNMISFQELINLYDGNGDIIRVFDNSFVWNDDGSITSTNSAEYFQDYDGCSKGYKVRITSKDWPDGTTSELREVVHDCDKNGALIRIIEQSHIQNNDGGTTSTESAEYFQDYEDILKGYKMNQITKTRADGTTSESIGEFTEPNGINTKEHYIQNEDGTDETHIETRKDGVLIRIIEQSHVHNADGSTTSTESMEYFQDYEDILKGYKMNQITKTKADGTTYEFHEEYTYPNGICYKSGFTTNANGAKENYFEEWKDGKKVSK